MFKATKPFKNSITNYSKEPSLRIGKTVPKDAVNLAYYYNPTPTNDEKVLTAESPRQTVDHRVETRYITLLDQASGPNGEEPSIDLFPAYLNYNDNDNYVGRLARQDNTVHWYPEEHIDQKGVTQDKVIIINQKGEEDKIIEYSDVEGYKGNLYLDATDYEVDTTRDVSTKEVLDYTIEKFELNYHTIFNKYINSDDMSYNGWTNVPNPGSGEDYVWPASIEVTATKLKASDNGATNNTIANYINSLNNNWEGENETLLNSSDIVNTSKPIGFLFFDSLEYEPVAYGVEPTDGTIYDPVVINVPIKSDEFMWQAEAENDPNAGLSYNNILPDLSKIKIQGTQLTDGYMNFQSSMRDPNGYSRIQSFLTLLSYQSPSCTAIKALNDAIDSGKDIAVFVTKITFRVKDQSIDMLVDGSNFEGF